jgi:hypothetical protein
VLGLLDLLQGWDALLFLVAPWRYLLSPRYRSRKQEEWKTLPPHRVQIEQIGGAFCFVLGMVVAGLLGALVWSAYHGTA